MTTPNMTRIFLRALMMSRPAHRIRRVLACILAALALAMLGGCAAPEAQRVDAGALSAEAKAAFELLPSTGERGVTLYGDPTLMTSKHIRMYAVLYGPIGQELTLSHFWKTLTIKLGGDAGEGYSVWRVEYNPYWVEKAYFEANGQEYRMDAYEELSFPVEEALRADFEDAAEKAQTE